MTLPLAGKRILVTRPVDQASRLAVLLEERGAAAVLIPTIELAPPASWCALDAALSCLRSFDWLIFTSANAVKAFAERARQIGVAPVARLIATIGPATLAALALYGVEGETFRLPAHSTAEGMVELLLPFAPGSSMLLVRAAQARDVLPEALVGAGAMLTIADAYRTVVPKASGALLKAAFAQGIDAITFTSASTVQNLVGLLDAAGLEIPVGVVLASIGPITSEALREVGLVVSVEAREATVLALAEALCGDLKCLGEAKRELGD